MYYYVAIVLLFRPFLKAKIISKPELVPRELARDAADRISDLWALHKRLYGYSGIYMFQVHILLTACTIHLISVPSPSPTSRFRDACDHFHELSTTHEWARAALNILRRLARKWNLILPQDVEAALYRDQGRPRSPSLHESSTPPPSYTQPTDPQNAVGVSP